MPINRVPLVALQSQPADLVGQFLRGRQFKQDQENQNRILDLRGEELGLRKQEAERAEQQRQAKQQADMKKSAEHAAKMEAERAAALAKAQNDYFGASADLILSAKEEDRPALYRQMRAIAVSNFGDLDDMPDEYSPETLEFAKNKAAFNGYESGETKGKVAAQEILGDGTTIQSGDFGTRVISPEGKLLEGKARADAVKQARTFEAEQAGTVSGQREGGKLDEQIDKKPGLEKSILAQKDAQKASTKAFEDIGRIRTSIINYDNAIAALDEGAQTGAVISKFPAIRSSSIKLKNAQQRLGLDVIGDVTFGALSKGELDLALSTAIPVDLQPQELRAWLVSKKQAQEIYADHIESAALFLAKPGNTIAGWVEENKGGDFGKPLQTDKAVTEMSDEELLNGF